MSNVQPIVTHHEDHFDPNTHIPIVCVLCGDAFQWDVSARGSLLRNEDYHTCPKCMFGTGVCEYYDCPVIRFTYKRRRNDPDLHHRFCSPGCREMFEKKTSRGVMMPVHYSGGGRQLSLHCVGNGTPCDQIVDARTQLRVGSLTIRCATCTAKMNKAMHASELEKIEEKKRRKREYSARRGVLHSERR